MCIYNSNSMTYHFKNGGSLSVNDELHTNYTLKINLKVNMYKYVINTLGCVFTIPIPRF